MDANLRTPRQHEIFDLKGRQGLSDMLAGRADQDAITKIDSFVDLSVLGAGTLPPNPQEMLSRSPFSGLNARWSPAMMWCCTIPPLFPLVPMP